MQETVQCQHFDCDRTTAILNSCLTNTQSFTPLCRMLTHVCMCVRIYKQVIHLRLARLKKGTQRQGIVRYLSSWRAVSKASPDQVHHFCIQANILIQLARLCLIRWLSRREAGRTGVYLLETVPE